MKKTNHRRWIVLTFIMLLLTFSFAVTVYAHGVVITYTLKTNGEVELLAEFDTGEPMTEAQVTIYSPKDPLNPWLTGTADIEGRYTFIIDPALPGIWDIQFRKAGHGDIVHLQLETGMIDPALMDYASGEWLPDTPPTKTKTAVEPELVVQAEVVPAMLSSGGNTAATGGFTSFQILLMSASVIWGFVGTALYFSSKKVQDHF